MPVYISFNGGDPYAGVHASGDYAIMLEGPMDSSFGIFSAALALDPMLAELSCRLA